MLVIDKYAYNNRILNIPPLKKFLFYLVLMSLSFSSGIRIQIMFILLLSPLICYVAHLKWKTYLKWLLLPLPFIIMSLITMMVSYTEFNSTNALLHVPFFNGYLVITQQGLEATERVFFRSYSCLTATYFFVLTVPFKQMLTLFKRLHLPKELLEIMVLMYRFIFIFLQEFIVMRDTLDLKFSFGSFRQSYKSMGLLASQLFTKLLIANRHMTEMLELRFDE